MLFSFTRNIFTGFCNTSGEEEYQNIYDFITVKYLQVLMGLTVK